MNNVSASAKTVNLDYLAASYAQKVVRNVGSAKDAKELDNLVTKTLGVLQENGIYAAMLFLAAQTRTDKVQHVLEGVLGFLNQMNQDLNFGWPPQPEAAASEKVLRYIADYVVVNLERLLLIKETLEQMLIYARYGARARVAEG